MATMEIDARRVIARRREERRVLLDRVTDWARHLAPALGVEAVVVFGSVARGDFYVWSDIEAGMWLVGKAAALDEAVSEGR